MDANERAVNKTQMMEGRKDVAVAALQEKAERGDTDCIWMLGVCYEDGVGVEQSVWQAEKLYESAAQRGNTTAAMVLRGFKSRICNTQGRTSCRSFLSSVQGLNGAAVVGQLLSAQVPLTTLDLTGELFLSSAILESQISKTPSRQVDWGRRSPFTE